MRPRKQDQTVLNVNQQLSSGRSPVLDPPLDPEVVLRRTRSSPSRTPAKDAYSIPFCGGGVDFVVVCCVEGRGDVFFRVDCLAVGAI